MNVIITSMPEKLPESVRGLIDEHTPLPANVAFFEERFTTGGALYKTAIGVALIGIGVLLALFGIYDLLHSAVGIGKLSTVDYWPLIAGVVCVFGGYLLVASLKARMKLASDQQGGLKTRYGIFLVDDLLVSRSWFDITVIPRPLFKGLVNHAIRYELEGAAKSFDLPKQIVGREAGEMDQAIGEWAKRGSGS
ncbi:hypothetical protein SAMN05519103_01060 [Rhizobiales bacterium GAS113]|nr:hypothetical protein SAMN05519103_01060 [Rhizobiales bacterium GAS113]SEC43267.1 hypothetical protein SAMN05519104_1372 [Rhizobiales bacterium GAS188]